MFQRQTGKPKQQSSGFKVLLTIIEQPHFALRKRKGNAGGAELFGDGLRNFQRRTNEVLHLDPGLDDDVDGRIAEDGNADDGRRLREHAWIGRQHAADDGDGFVQIRPVSDADRNIKLPDMAEVVQDFADDFAVGNNDS